MEVTVEIDEQKIIDDLTATDIFEMSGMDESNCKDQFGIDLLNEFSLAEIIEYCGEGKLLNEIGEGVVIKHFGIEEAE